MQIKTREDEPRAFDYLIEELSVTWLNQPFAFEPSSVPQSS